MAPRQNHNMCVVNNKEIGWRCIPEEENEIETCKLGELAYADIHNISWNPLDPCGIV